MMNSPIAEDDLIRMHIVNICINNGITRYKLANTSGVSYAALCRFLNGKTNITFYMLKKICFALEIPFTELLMSIFYKEEPITAEEKKIIFAWRNMDASLKHAIYTLMSQFDAKLRKVDQKNEKC